MFFGNTSYMEGANKAMKTIDRTSVTLSGIIASGDSVFVMSEHPFMLRDEPHEAVG